MMLKLEMLPAACGDCLWLEYGTPTTTRIVIIDGGLRDTAVVLQERLDAARRARDVATLEVELLVVTHIDNDHILGIIELLKDAAPVIKVKDIWFNGRPQLMRLPAPSAASRDAADPSRPADLMGGGDQSAGSPANLNSPADLLGPQQGDELSELLAARGLPWNRHSHWNGEAVRIPDSGALPSVTLDGELKLTLLGPTLARLYKLCTAWPDVLGGTDEPGTSAAVDAPDDLLGRRDTWPPRWKDGEQRDPSHANGSSIMLLAEYGPHALLLAGDGHAPDLAAALDRLRDERGSGSAPLPLTAFKLPHHGSDKNLTRAVLEKIDCQRFLVSTDGSTHKHPDHQAMLRILRYSRGTPELHFNYLCDTTRPWRDSKSDVLRDEASGPDVLDYRTVYPVEPTDPADGLSLVLD